MCPLSIKIESEGNNMNLFIAEAWAQAPAASSQGLGQYGGLLMLVVLFVAFYFLLIRPQAKRAKDHKTMIAALAKGDEVVTAGGTLGRITNVSENFITLEIAEGVETKVQRQSIQSVMPKGTIKST
jgi:preprotein translocase subunit YajC